MISVGMGQGREGYGMGQVQCDHIYNLILALALNEVCQFFATIFLLVT